MATRPSEGETLKLTYFPVRGRVEPARLMLELAKVPYEFEGIPMERWATPEGKERMFECTPFGQLPVLRDGSFTLCQSQAISRYIARKLDLDGNTLEEKARVDEVSETASEEFLHLGMLFWDPRFQERRAAHRETMTKKLDRLDKYFARVGADAEHWVLPGRYTRGDVMMAFFLETLHPLHPSLLNDFPKLHHCMTAFFAAGGVRDYVRSERRPRTWTVGNASFAGRPEETHHWTD